MRKAWKIEKLGDVCCLDKNQNKNEALPYVGLEDIIGGTGEFVGSLTPKRVQSSTFKFTRGHVLYGRLRPYLNKVFMPNFDGHCSTEIFPIRSSPTVDPRFLFYWLSMEKTAAEINLTSTGARMPRANMGIVLAFAFPHPPLPEQRRVVSILDEAFAGLAIATANAEKNLKNAWALFDGFSKSILQDRNDRWRRVQLQSLIEQGWIVGHLDGNHGNDYPRKEEFMSHGVPYVSANCLRNNNVDMSLAKFLSPQRAASLRKGVAQNRDVLFAHNATVGPVTVLYTAEPKVILSTSLTYYRCDQEHIVPEYLAHYMRSPEFKLQYEAVMRQSTRNQVPITKQREFYHLIPPVDKQHEIAARLDSLSNETRRLDIIYRQRLIYLSELRQSILQNAFAGELTTGRESQTVVPFRKASRNTATASFGASVLAVAYEKHRAVNREKTFGHVKAQKLLHLVEAVAEIDLGRDPIKDAAGPNDFDHLRRVEDWAEQHAFFKFHKFEGRYHFQKLQRYGEHLAGARSDLHPYSRELTRVIDLLIPMDTQKAEVLATVYAAWNNMLLDAAPITDGAIVRAARDDWHPDKLQIPRHRFVEAIKLLRSKNLIPEGKAKRVREKYLI